MKILKTYAGWAGTTIAMVSALCLCHAQSIPNAPYLSVPQRCAFLVLEPAVSKNLSLTSEQSKSIASAEATYNSKVKQFGSAANFPFKEAEANDQWVANKYLNSLTEAQRSKLLQAGLRRIGPEALADPTIAAKVGITKSHQVRIKEQFDAIQMKDEDVSAKMGEAIAGLLEPKPGASRKAYNSAVAQITHRFDGDFKNIAEEKRALEKSVIDSLSAPQMTNWTVIAGSK